MNNVQVV